MRMTEKVLEVYLLQLLRAQPGGEITVAWQGGEPTLMGVDFFQRSITLVNKLRRSGQRVSYTLQTNGTLLDEKWCKFFKQHDFLIGLSLDGTDEMHDAYRVNQAGGGSFDRALRSWNLLHKHQVQTNILCAVHAANASRPLEVYRFFRDTLGAQFVQFIPIVERLNSSPCAPVEEQVSPRSVKPDQYGSFLSAIFDEWVQHDIGSMFIQGFEAALASWCGLPASLCIFQQVCGRSVILEHNGDLYSCDHFVDSDHRLGNILERSMVELVRSAQQRQFGLDKRERLPECCRKCQVLFACQGECPRNRFAREPGGEGNRLNYLCPSYKAFFHHIDGPMRQMADLLRRGRAPAEIMPRL